MTKLSLTAGVDEVGRGPLAGPVIASAVILDPSYKITGLRDSKKLSESKRNELYEIIMKRAIAVSLGRAEVEEIDKINIRQATLLAMRRAVLGLKTTPSRVLVDGRDTLELMMVSEAIIGGDDIIPEISAASIVAKVTRDREMMILDKQYPQYGFKDHKGYGTRQHLAAIAEFGPCPLHRRSFSPIKDAVALEST